MSLIRTCVNNPVAVNILMALVCLIGAWKAATIVREFFPQASLDRIVISTPYPGATPEEVERGLITKMERAVEGIRNIEQITSRALDNYGVVILKVKTNDIDKLADEVRNEIDKIYDLPPEAEETTVEVLEQLVPAISVVVYGTAPERRLKQAAEVVKDDLLAEPFISRVMVTGTRAEEISIEVRPGAMEAYNLTFEEVGRAVRNNNVDLAAGEIKAPDGKLVVRTLGESQRGMDIERILLRGAENGESLRLADVATVRDYFEDNELRGTFQGQRAIQITVFKRGDEDAIRISKHVRDYIQRKSAEFLGQDIRISYRTNLANLIQDRIDLLTKNAAQGLVLVFASLALFLSLRVAFWVGVGLLVSFLGTFIVMDFMGASINMISLFGLLIVIGLIVDDAIVVAENIYAKMESGMPPHVAAVEGTQEVAGPVVATVLTTVVAFLPLAFMEGVVGDFLAVLPVVVIASLMLSLLECFTMLPSHLAEHGRPEKKQKAPRHDAVARWTAAAAAWKDRVLGDRLTGAYVALLRFALSWRYVTLGVAIFISMFTIALMAAGKLPFVLFQKLDADTLVAEVEMASGTTAEETQRVLDRIVAEAMRFPEVRNVYSAVGFREEAEIKILPDPAKIGEVVIELVSAEERNRSGDEILNAWRAGVGLIPGAVVQKFRARSGGPPGAEIEIRVRGRDTEMVAAAVRHVRETMSRYVGVQDIEDDGGTGKLELRVRMKDGARALGLSVESIARQVRGAFFGFEAQRLQRGRDEVRVYVRLAEDARRSLSDLLRLRVETPSGARVPLSEVADIEVARGVSAITRMDGLRTTTITADVDFARANTAEVTAALEAEFANIDQKFQGVTLTFEGAKKETAESIASLAVGFPVALLMIYCILAILFKSYVQPLMVMVAIPYGIVGAALGHLIYGLLPGREALPITFISLIGIVGLSGIVVNDSLILVTFINDARRRAHARLFDAVVEAGRRRFRPIMLTSLTTVAGLGPIMLETSFQAQFLIPLAVSIAFGLTLATVLTLLLLPCLYMILEDLRTFGHWVYSGRWERVELIPEELLSDEEKTAHPAP